MFDTLEDILADALARLEQGRRRPRQLVAQHGAGYHRAGRLCRRRARWCCAASTAPARVLEVHTDTRSAKHAELRARSSATLHGWDAGAQVQLRISGQASLHTGDDAALAWAALRPESRATYRVRPGPGTVLATPDATGQADERHARSVFCVVRLMVGRLEWLHLGQGGHRRARFTWDDAGTQAMWLVP